MVGFHHISLQLRKNLYIPPPPEAVAAFGQDACIAPLPACAVPLNQIAARGQDACIAPLPALRATAKAVATPGQGACIAPWPARYR